MDFIPRALQPDILAQGLKGRGPGGFVGVLVKMVVPGDNSEEDAKCILKQQLADSSAGK